MSVNALSDSSARKPALAAEQRSSLWLLLASLVVLQFGYPVTDAGTWWTVAYLLVYGGVIAFGVRTVRPDPRRYWPVAAASVALVVGGTWFAVQQDSVQATGAMLCGVGLLQLTLLVVLLTRLIRPPDDAHTVDLLLVAVCAYLLMGGVFGVAASLIEFGQPGSFVDNAHGAVEVGWQSLFYGSFVTLATLGYGDVVPVEAWARALWSFEGVAGTLFLAVVIARLVGVAGFAERDRRSNAS
ncbi:potassium channel family protein [Demequina sp. NBRC 110053]|uniref:potassium channel family protein n=1 Tax=Demequina sp. NBRC 110053 TaxID=1570342 RepID=UPI0009FF030C|nr:potassium channel family protein [Demequina sp. NBRC 110053]